MTQPDPPLTADGLRSNPSGEAGDRSVASLETLAPPTREDVIEEVRQLVTDLRDATQDGRILAKRYAEVLQTVVDEYCLEFEKRAEAAIEKLQTFK